MRTNLVLKGSTLSVAIAALGLGAASARAAGDLLPPFRVEAGGKPIEALGGNAVPCVMDFDGKGAWDLLVGQFQQGKLLIFTNAGSAVSPKFSTGVWFKAGGADARVPSG